MESTKRETGIQLRAEIDFFTSTMPRQALGATRSVSDWHRRLFPWGYEIGAWRWPLNSIHYRGREYVDFFIYGLL